VLVDQYAVAVQRLKAAAVELLCKEPRRVAEGVGRVVDDQVVLVLLGAQEAQPVLIGHLHARIVEPAGVGGKEPAANVHKELVLLDHVDGFDLLVVRQFAGNAAVPAADDKHALHVRVHRHWYVDDHLVVGELVLFREDHAAVRGEKPPELGGIEHVDTLIVALAGKQLLFHPNRELHILRMHVVKPEFQFSTPPLNR